MALVNVLFSSYSIGVGKVFAMRSVVCTLTECVGAKILKRKPVLGTVISEDTLFLDNHSWSLYHFKKPSITLSMPPLHNSHTLRELSGDCTDPPAYAHRFWPIHLSR